MSYVAMRTAKRTAQLRDRANDKRNVKARQLRSLSRAASQVGADMVMTPASQVATLIPGTYRSSNLWAMTVKGSGEAKYCDEIDDGTYINDAWKIQSFVNIAQGSGASQRVGRSVTVQNFHITGFLMGNAALPVYHRVVVLIDKQANGALPAAADVFTINPTVGSGSIGYMNAYRNLDNIHRFEVLYDKKFAVKPPIAGMTDPPATSFKISRKKRIEVEWSGTDGSNSTIRSNNLVMMVYTYGISAGPNPTPAPQQLRHVMRVRYLDQ